MLIFRAQFLNSNQIVYTIFSIILPILDINQLQILLFLQK
jgi:hypothetical protein